MATKNFFDVDEAVTEWAWRQYDATATLKQKRLREKERKNKNGYIEVRIDWRDVRVTDETQWTNLIDDVDSDSTQQQQHQQPQESLGPRVSVLFQTEFTNNTADQQEYTMRTEKTTRSSLSTCVETGFTHGVEMSVKLASPCQVFEANAGYKREQSLTKVDGETFEEELTWGVESLIRVKPNHVAKATLLVDEKHQTGNFVVTTQMRGMVYVTFTSLRDNNSFIKSVGNDVGDVITEYLEREWRKFGGKAGGGGGGKGKGTGTFLDSVEVTDGRVVVVKTKGSCKFRYGVKQQIRVDQTEIRQ